MTANDQYPQLQALEGGAVYHFRDWPNRAIPRAVAGVYTIWDGAELIYVGMAGRVKGLLTAQPGRATGLFSRLASHASGRRSGDQFCVYVCDRLVLKELSSEQIEQIAAGRGSLDQLTKHYIHGRLSYRFIQTDDGRTALQIEHLARAGALTVGRPLLNPLKSPVPKASA